MSPTPARKSLADWRKIKGTPLAREKGAGRNRDTDECRKVWQYAAKVCREQRRRLGLTLEQLAIALELSRAQINNFELGKSGLGISRIPRLAEALRIPCADLLPPEFSR